MAREKQFVFSARTTEEGLKAPNEVKARLKVGWDDLVVDAVCEHYGLDLAVIALPPSKFLEEQKARRQAREAEKAVRKAEREAKAKATKAAEKKAKGKVEKPAKKTAKQVVEALA